MLRQKEAWRQLAELPQSEVSPKHKFFGYLLALIFGLHLVGILAVFVVLQFFPNTQDFQPITEWYFGSVPIFSEVTLSNVDLARVKYGEDTAFLLLNYRIILQLLTGLFLVTSSLVVIPVLFFSKKVYDQKLIIISMMFVLLLYMSHQVFVTNDFSNISGDADTFWTKLDGGGFGAYALFSWAIPALVPFCFGFAVLKLRVIFGQRSK